MAQQVRCPAQHEGRRARARPDAVGSLARRHEFRKRRFLDHNSLKHEGFRSLHGAGPRQGSARRGLAPASPRCARARGCECVRARVSVCARWVNAAPRLPPSPPRLAPLHLDPFRVRRGGASSPTSRRLSHCRVGAPPCRMGARTREEGRRFSLQDGQVPSRTRATFPVWAGQGCRARGGFRLSRSDALYKVRSGRRARRLAPPPH